jgi:hypothetical protein
VTGTLARILKGWLSLLRGAGVLLAAAAAAAGLAALISLPLWAAATSAPAAYSLGILGLLAAAAVFIAVRAVLRARGVPRDPSRPRGGPLRVLLSIAAVLAFAAGLYAVALLAARGLWAAAVPLLVAWLALAGWAAFGRQRRR